MIEVKVDTSGLEDLIASGGGLVLIIVLLLLAVFADKGDKE